MKKVLKQILIPALMALAAMILVVVSGRKCTASADLTMTGLTPEEAEQCIAVPDSEGIISLDSFEVKDGVGTITVSSVSEGMAFADIMYNEDNIRYFVFYVHSFGVITYGSYYGKSTGDIVIPVMICLYLVYAVYMRIRIYQAEKRKPCTATATCAISVWFSR